MRTRPNIRLWLRRSKTDAAAPRTATTPGTVYCTITVHKSEAIFSTGIYTTCGQWDIRAQRLVGKDVPTKQANEYLIKLIDRINDLAADLDRQEKTVTAKRLHQLYQKNGAKLSLLELFTEFIAERKTLVGVEIAASTIIQHRTRYRKLAEFLQVSKLTDLRPEEFTHNLADKYLHWLFSNGQKRNTANGLIKTVGQVLRWGVRREHLEKSPLELYQIKMQASNGIKYLTASELAHLSTVPMPGECLDKVRDCFVFQCWTGLAYADLAALDMKAVEYHKQADNTLRRVLRIRRAKSTITQGYECVIPLLPEAERILSKYQDWLPVPTNQVYNRYLKQVGELAGLATDKMTTHVGRKTAGTLLLNMGVPLPVVSKFLGHANTVITQQLYAKLLDTTVVDAFVGLFGVDVSPSIEARYRRGEVCKPHEYPSSLLRCH